MEEILHCELPLIVTKKVSRRIVIHPHMVLKETAKVCEVTVQQMKSATRKREVTVARHVYAYLCRKHTSHTYFKIGEETNRDHSTMIFGSNKVKDWLTIPEYFRELYPMIASIEDKLT